MDPAPAAGEELPAAAMEALTELYARVDALLAEHQPICKRSGLCCDFPRSDHELWSSALETAYARQAVGGEVPPAPSGLCPWHVEGSCRNREGRPLGCRLYFCDPAWAGPMPDAYERFHAELKALHEEHGVGYRYERFVDAVVRDAPGGPAAEAPDGGPSHQEESP